jgi:hypothetical protein
MDRSLLPTWGFEYLSHRVCGNGGISIRGAGCLCYTELATKIEPLRGIPDGKGSINLPGGWAHPKPRTLKRPLKGSPKVSEAAECQLRERMWCIYTSDPTY